MVGSLISKRVALTYSRLHWARSRPGWMRSKPDTWGKIISTNRVSQMKLRMSMWRPQFTSLSFFFALASFPMRSQVVTPRHLRAFAMQLMIHKTPARQLTLSERVLKEASPQRCPITSHWLPNRCCCDYRRYPIGLYQTLVDVPVLSFGSYYVSSLDLSNLKTRLTKF